jgi:CheY-like chemotaxis protein
VGEASSGKEAIKIAGDLELDCLVLDIDLQDRNGIEVIKAIRRNNQKLPILVLSMHPPSQYAARILSAGALGYITKSEPTQELVLAIRRVASGAKYISPIVAEILAREFLVSLRARGLTDMTVLKHVIRNALPMVLAVVGLQIGYLMGGSILIETVFSWPGTGFLLNIAIFQRDFPLLQGIVLILCMFFVILNLVIDILQSILDPRIMRS